MCRLQKNKNKKKGFSLIEVLLTLLLLSIGITSVAALMTGNIKNYSNSRDQIIASVPAQEAIELVRNLKDSGRLESNVSGVCNFAQNGSCNAHDLIIDATTTSDIEKAANVQKTRLYLSGNFFTHDTGGEEMKFYRALDIDITGVGTTGRVVTVTSYVTWNGSGLSSIAGFPGSCNIANKCLSIVSVMPDV